MHAKERVLAPVLAALGAIPELASIDTDAFGTFSGTVPRRGTQLEAAVAKAAAAREQLGTSAGVASEGAYGPDPVIGIVPLGFELVVYVEAHRCRPVIGRIASHGVVAGNARVESLAAARREAERLHYPDHGLLVRTPGHAGGTAVHNSWDALERAVRAVLRSGGHVELESDLRAHRNPTRMLLVAEAARDLADHLADRCDVCACTGLTQVDPQPGLPCEDCGTPTELLLQRRLVCSWCEAPHERAPHHGLAAADPGNCPRCNP